jgi:hypothetical protein
VNTNEEHAETESEQTTVDVERRTAALESLGELLTRLDTELIERDELNDHSSEQLKPLSGRQI